MTIKKIIIPILSNVCVCDWVSEPSILVHKINKTGNNKTKAMQQCGG